MHHRLANLLVAAFLDHLTNAHSVRSRRRYGAVARHLLVWLARSGVPVSQVDENVVDRFSKHQCRCPSFSPHALEPRDDSDRGRRFVRFLEERVDIPVLRDFHDLPGHLLRFAGHLRRLATVRAASEAIGRRLNILPAGFVYRGSGGAMSMMSFSTGSSAMIAAVQFAASAARWQFDPDPQHVDAAHSISYVFCRKTVLSLPRRPSRNRLKIRSSRIPGLARAAPGSFGRNDRTLYW